MPPRPPTKRLRLSASSLFSPGLVAGLTLLSSLGAARAQWIGTSSGLNYNDTTNWNGGTINDTFQGPYNWQSDQAVSAITGTTTNGSTTITFANTNSANTGGQFAVGQAISGTNIPSGTTVTAVSATSITISAAATASGSVTNLAGTALTPNPWLINLGTTTVGSGNRTLPGNFSYVNPDAANVTFAPVAPSSTTTWTFSSSAPTITVDMGTTYVGRTFQLGANSTTINTTLDFGAGTGSASGSPTFAVSPGAANFGSTGSTQQGADTMNVYATIANAVSLTKTGGGVLNAYRPVTVTGAVNVTGGLLQLNGSSSKITGATAYNVTGQDVVLSLDGGTTTNQIGTSAPVNLFGGSLALVGTSTQSVGAVNVSGNSSIQTVVGSTNALTLASLTRQNSGTLVFQAYGALGSTNQVFVTSDSNLTGSNLVGGGGAAGSTTISILPWASAAAASTYGAVLTLGNNAYGGTDLVTYTSGTGSGAGFRVLASGEYYTPTAATSLVNGTDTTDNVYLNVSGTLASSQTINALKVSGQTENLGGNTLTISAGEIVSTGNYTISNGTINTGSQPLITFGRTNDVISANITNSITSATSPGLIVANGNTNTVTLSGTNNSYGGFTLVEGVLVAGNNGALPSGTELRIDNTGTTQIGSGVTATVSKLSGTGVLTFLASGAGNQFNVGTGVTGANNAVTVGTGGTIAPGNPSGALQVGALTLGSNVTALTLNTGSTLAINLAGDTAFNQILSTSTGTKTLNINGGTLALTYLNGYTPANGTSYLLTTGFTATTGAATNLSVTDNIGDTYSLSFLGNNLDLTVTGIAAVPEPSTAIFPALVIVGCVWQNRRRKQAAA